MDSVELLQNIFNPSIWGIAAVAWCLSAAFNYHSAPKVRPGKTPPLKTASPGSLYSDGNTATSKLEMSIRRDLERRGFRFYPQGTALITYPDEKGKKHRYTPDMICKNRKLIVEVDPLFTHEGKEDDDARRGRLYQQLGYGVVRIRMGKGMRALGKYDVVIPYQDYRPHADLHRIVSAMRKAVPEKRSRTTWKVQ